MAPRARIDAVGCGASIYLLTDELSDPLPGVCAWFCDAHHCSSMCFVVPTGAGRVALTDTIFHYRKFEESIPLGIAECVDEHCRLPA
ncbi:MAG: hypothetical protein Q7S40_10040 [Opitutaceae bacterium]|nr:hypothetical protein [Opitutaceae bacterium]